MDITPRKRASIVALRQHSGLSVRDISVKLSVSKSTVGRIVKKMDTIGDVGVTRKGKCGRKRKSTDFDERVLLRNSNMNPRKTSQELQRDWSAAGVDVHSSTVRKRLLEHGRRARKPIKKQLLTDRMQKQRLAWAKKYKNWTIQDWEKVIFSDESHFEVHGYRSIVVRRTDGEAIRPEHIQQAPKHPPKKMFWGSFTVKGPGRLIPVEGTMRSQQYEDVLRTHLIPTISRDFPQGGAIFQQDKAPCHTSNHMKRFFASQNLTILEWPGNSPDINPIENLWSIVKRRIAKNDCSTMAKLIINIIKCWYHDEELKQMCSTLVRSMPRRVAAVIKAKGGHTKY